MGSSPHARGCSEWSPLSLRTRPVVPARAGVFPTRGGAHRGGRCRPRTRGGVPPDIPAEQRLLGSSPHARGCSRASRRSPPRRRVVPARAGVFPARRRRRTGRARRPRTRGGVPAREMLDRYWTESSPHARGCSGRRHAPVAPRHVVPARAGVFPVPAPRRAPAHRRPRTRGGVPWHSMSLSPGDASSPHARGCSRETAALARTGPVVPARAGVFRNAASTRACVTRRPRTRGGVPVRWTVSTVADASSPHARGCSPGAERVGLLSGVVPARAGVFPATPSWCITPSRRPRTRGGVPRSREARHLAVESSPHARGCSALSAGRPTDWEVVPARAGVFRLRCCSPATPASRPRTRGGVPVERYRSELDRESSPHARGCSQDLRDAVEARDVVPARAGVFPTTGARVSPSRSRPRTRGGVPWARLVDAPRGGSSPHARGCSDHARRYGGVGLVVPARAGVFPRAPGIGGAPSSRPRTRGGVPPASLDLIDDVESSPHARGCSPLGLLRTRSAPVVPARAGVFRPRRCRGLEGWSRPRTRGGVPACDSWRASPVRSSPHARGCSPHAARFVFEAAVVPARAGVFRSPTCRCPTSTGRPRTRGGVPVAVTVEGLADGSSPHARGCSAARSDDGLGRTVVPARAGVFRVRPREVPGEGRRPRTRGGVPRHEVAAVLAGRSSPHARGCSADTGTCWQAGRVVPARAGVFRLWSVSGR